MCIQVTSVRLTRTIYAPNRLTEWMDGWKDAVKRCLVPPSLTHSLSPCVRGPEHAYTASNQTHHRHMEIILSRSGHIKTERIMTAQSRAASCKEI